MMLLLQSYILVSEFMEGGTLSSGITPHMQPRTYLGILVASSFLETRSQLK